MRIVTHSAKFHTDDVFAVACLYLLLGAENCEVIRTRDPEEIRSADYVVDVGEVYDPATRRFDHHQLGGAGKRANGIPYASFGLVWKEYGRELAGSEEAADLIDQMLVQPIDGPDNGVDVFRPVHGGVFPFTVASVIDLYRTTWKEADDWDNRFLEAVAWAATTLSRQIKVVQDILEGSSIIRAVYAASDDKRLIVFDEKHNFGRELISATLTEYPEPLYAVFHRADADEWQVVSIRNEQISFVLRKPLPEAWRAKHGEELERITGVRDAIFCHSTGFLCITRTKESALALAEIALNS